MNLDAAVFDLSADQIYLTRALINNTLMASLV
jgi:hypothetical protein